MTSAVAAFVILGIAVAVYLGVVAGFDLTAVIIFVLIIAVGLLAVAVAHKAGIGRIGPAYCTECRGVVSPNAPYCKHCGATLQ
ncbi:MAG TPA: hypothetical protein VEV82_10540 [Actinomycetota bacterium]|nr:hypothetical protein [Actinomycetota bacterium]